MRLTEYEAALEAILFAIGGEVSIAKLAVAINQDDKTTLSLVSSLAEKYIEENRGIKIIEIDGTYQLCTNPDFFDYIEKLVQIPQKRQLTPALLETLAIIAYKQPITKGQIEEIRGVAADHAVNKLMQYDLVVEKGRMDTPGRPVLLATSDEFLKYFGFSKIDKLPPLTDDIHRLKEEAERELNQ